MKKFKGSKIERQELHCHNCDKYVQFDIDLSLNGNHILNCPNCGHEHCRVVKNGIITDDRWDSRNSADGYMHQVQNITYTSASYSTSSTSYFMYSSWLQTGTGY